MEKEGFFVRIYYQQYDFIFLFYFKSIIILLVYRYVLFFYRFEDVILDFESVFKLNKDIVCVYVNLGLIYMNYYENYYR